MTSAFRIQTQLADMGRHDDVGATLWPLRARFVPPFVKMQGDYLLWHWRLPEESGVRFDRRMLEPAPTKGALEQFLKIRDGADVLRYAQRFGVLMLCKHRWPAFHNPDLPNGAWIYELRHGRYAQPIPIVRRRYVAGCRPRGWKTDESKWSPIWEPVADWLRLVEEAQRLLAMAACLRIGNIPPASLYEHLEGIAWPMSREDALAILMIQLNEWFRVSDVRIVVANDDGAAFPSVNLACTTFGVIAVQLASAITKAHSLTQCDGCATPYWRQGRAAPRGRHNFCPACQGTVANRVRRREHSVRKEGRNGKEG